MSGRRIEDLEGLLSKVFTQEGEGTFKHLRNAIKQSYSSRVIGAIYLKICAHPELVGKLHAEGGHQYMMDYLMAMKLEEIGYRPEDVEWTKQVAYERFVIEYGVKHNEDHPIPKDVHIMNAPEKDLIPISRQKLEEILRPFLPEFDKPPLTTAELIAAATAYHDAHPNTKVPFGSAIAQPTSETPEPQKPAA